MFPRLFIVATLIACASSVHSMEISREQCELIRTELIASSTSLKNLREAMRRTELAMLDLATLNFEIKQMGGDRVSLITDRLQKAIDEVSAAGKDSLTVSDHFSPGAIAFMNVCGSPL